VLADLRQAAAAAKRRHPEVKRVLLFGSLVRGNWTADSDADLMVVVGKEFPCVLDRSPYQIHASGIPTDTLVYSEREFEEMARDPRSFVARNLAQTLEL
jgi:predicted nucleotidyltransferase